MTDLLLHSQTVKHLDLFRARPLHALLLIGPAGSGKRTVARRLAAELLGAQYDDLEHTPFYFELKPVPPKQEISIDAVRQVIRDLRLTTTGSRAVQRVILLEDAQRMSLEAQNALLKTLEEPSARTVFILTAPTAESLLPTIASRAHHIYLRPISIKQAQRHFKRFPRTKVESAWHLSGGQIGLLQSLLNEEKEHALVAAVEQAKQFLRADQYTRLMLLNSQPADRQQLLTLLDALGRVLRALYTSKLDKTSKPKLLKILASRKLVDALRQALLENANPKLVGLQLALNLDV